MDREVMMKIWDLQEKMMEDEEYQELCDKREMMSELFMTALKTMAREEEVAMLDFYGYLIEVHYKTIEYLVK